MSEIHLRSSDLIRLIPKLLRERGWSFDFTTVGAPGSRLTTGNPSDGEWNRWENTVTGNTSLPQRNVQVLAGMPEWMTARTMLHEMVHTYLDTDSMWFMKYLQDHGIPSTKAGGTLFDPSEMSYADIERLHRDKRTQPASEVMTESTVQIVLNALGLMHGPAASYSDWYLKNWVTGYVVETKASQSNQSADPSSWGNNTLDSQRVEDTANEIVSTLRTMKKAERGRY